jgi:predicted ester cyclase
VQVNSFNFYRFRDGRIAEQWITFDTMSLMQQIGAIPVPA